MQCTADPAQVLPAIQQWFLPTEPIPTEIVVRWQQLSVIFCTAHEGRLRFGGNSLLLLPADFQLREHLLFVHYDAYCSQLTVYGGLSLDAYREQCEQHGSIACAVLCTERPLLYSLLSVERKHLPAMRRLQPYYVSAPEWHPLDTRDETDEQTLLCLDEIYAQVTGLAVNTQPNTISALSPTQLADQLYTRLLEDTYSPVRRFHLSLFLAALNPAFCQHFIAHELALLSLRFQFCYRSEQQRAVFAHQWFPGLLRIHELCVSAQFYDLPLELASEDAVEDTAAYGCLCAQHVDQKRAAAGLPYPSVVFNCALQYAGTLQLAPALECRAGRLRCSHYELEEVLRTYLDQFLRLQVVSLQRKFKLYYARQLWTRLYLPRQGMGWTRATALHEFRQVHRLQPAALVEQVIASASAQCDRWPLMRRFVLPMLGALDGSYGENELQSEQQWPPRETRGQATSDTAGAYTLGVLPTSCDELVQYAAQHFPECMYAMVLQCATGEQSHLKHHQRIGMSALLRHFGYSDQQGTELWSLLFSRTAVGARADFLTTKQGRVIVDDYKNNKQTQQGVSCRSLLQHGLCAVKQAHPEVQDIEDIQRRCTACYGARPENGGRVLAFPIKSPRNYFNLARRSIETAEALAVEINFE